ncbi:MAG: hypothetical protein JG763_2548 [Shewanella sp.]|nr:hypothetical protein [Shewanella sp.]MBZ4679919.1 hypothetical protein [Shewanella sp.]
MNHISDIQQLESQLHSAMLNSDINLLDRLLSEVDPNGWTHKLIS